MVSETIEKRIESIEQSITKIDKYLQKIHADILIHRSECREMAAKQDKE